MPFQAFVYLRYFCLLLFHGAEFFLQPPHRVVELHPYLVQAFIEKGFLLVALLQLQPLRAALGQLRIEKLLLLPGLLYPLPDLFR